MSLRERRRESNERPEDPTTDVATTTNTDAVSPWRTGVDQVRRENNRRFMRVTPDEEARLLAASNSLVHMLVVAALDTGMRRGELLNLRFGDIDWDRQLIHVRPEIAKEQKGTRYTNRNDAAAYAARMAPRRAERRSDA